MVFFFFLSHVCFFLLVHIPVLVILSGFGYYYFFAFRLILCSTVPSHGVVSSEKVDNKLIKHLDVDYCISSKNLA